MQPTRELRLTGILLRTLHSGFLYLLVAGAHEPGLLWQLDSSPGIPPWGSHSLHPKLTGSLACARQRKQGELGDRGPGWAGLALTGVQDQGGTLAGSSRALL